MRAIEERALGHAEDIRQQAVAEASAAQLQAREQIVQMLITGRDQRTRADAEAAATRKRLDRDAAVRRASPMAEVEDLEHRLAALTAGPDRTPAPAIRPSGALHLLLRGLLDRVQARLGWHLRR